MTVKPEEKNNQKIVLLIGVILILFGIGQIKNYKGFWIFQGLAYYGLYLLILTLTDRPGISFPNAYKVIIAIIALIGVWWISRAWIASSFWAGIGPEFGEHIKSITEAIIEILEYLKQASTKRIPV